MTGEERRAESEGKISVCVCNYNSMHVKSQFFCKNLMNSYDSRMYGEFFNSDCSSRTC
jgi:hypothetical protein